MVSWNRLVSNGPDVNIVVVQISQHLLEQTKNEFENIIIANNYIELPILFHFKFNVIFINALYL